MDGKLSHQLSFPLSSPTPPTKKYHRTSLKGVLRTNSSFWGWAEAVVMYTRK